MQAAVVYILILRFCFVCLPAVRRTHSGQCDESDAISQVQIECGDTTMAAWFLEWCSMAHTNHTSWRYVSVVAAVTCTDPVEEN